MNRMVIAIFGLLVMGSARSSAQIAKSPVQAYTIDASVQDTVMAQIRRNNVDDPGVGVMYVKVWQEDTMRWNNLDNPAPEKNNGTAFLALTCVSGDTIRIMSTFGNRCDPAGFYLEIFRYTCRIRYKPYGEMCGFGIISGDTTIRAGVIPCVSSRLVLARPPCITNGTIIEGTIELESAKHSFEGDWCGGGTGRGKLKAYFITSIPGANENIRNKEKLLNETRGYHYETNSYAND